MRQRICKRCGAVFRAEAYQRYCPDCRHAIKSDSVLRPRTCSSCGTVFPGYPRSRYCPECAAQRKRESTKAYHRTGASRPIGSTDLCEKCGSAYTVQSARQRYCPDCSPSAVRYSVNARKRAYMAEHSADNSGRKKQLNTDSLVCSVCGKTFTANTATNVCSEECAAERNRIQQKKADTKRSPRRRIPKGDTP